MKHLLFLAGLLLALPAAATTYYVDGSATGCSGSPCSDSNNGTAEATAWLTVTKCITKPLVAGDTCLIKNGTYPGPATANVGGRPAPSYDFVGMNGTAGNPITFKNFPGHSPILCRGPSSCATTGNKDALGTGELQTASYVVIQGLAIQGATWFWNSNHITITGNDLSEGGGECDGNWSVLRLEQSNNMQVDHNLIHNLVTTGVCSPSNGGANNTLALEFVVNAYTFEYNTLEQTNGQYMSIAQSIKDCPLNNTYRYNYYKNGKIWGPFQANCGSSTNNKLYGNVLLGDWEPLKRGSFLYFYNNTMVGGVPGFNADSDPASFAISDVQFYNNIISNPSSSQNCSAGGQSGCNIVLQYGAWSKKSGYVWDYNAYDSDAAYNGDRYLTNIVSTDISAWRSAFGSPHDAKSFESNSGTSGGPCTFTAGGDTPYHVTAATTCKTGACSNWPTCSTTTTEYGAYGVTSCVGYQCSATATCGNSVLEAGETCDDGDTVTETACDYGTPSCTLCDAACATVLNLAGPYCGDNILNGTEVCDTSQLNGKTCATQFCNTGTLSCSSCAFNISACGIPFRAMKRPTIGWGR